MRARDYARPALEAFEHAAHGRLLVDAERQQDAVLGAAYAWVAGRLSDHELLLAVTPSGAPRTAPPPAAGAAEHIALREWEDLALHACHLGGERIRSIAKKAVLARDPALTTPGSAIADAFARLPLSLSTAADRAYAEALRGHPVGDDAWWEDSYRAGYDAEEAWQRARSQV